MILEMTNTTVSTRIYPDPHSEGVYIGVNTTATTIPPVFTAPKAPEGLEPHAVWKIQWLYDPYFYLAFLPCGRRYPGILADLDMIPATVPIQTNVVHRHRITYTLDPIKVDEIMSLYAIAYNMRIFFCNYTHLRHNRSLPFTPGDTIFSSFAVSREDLTQPRANRGGVIAVTLSARDSIMTMFAWISYCVAWHTYPNEENGNTPPHWYLNMMYKHTVPDYVLRALSNTWVFDLGANRLGGCVPVTLPLQYDRESQGAASTTWIRNLQHIIRAVPHMPLYLHYPECVRIPTPKQWELVLHWQPSSAKVATAREQIREQLLGQQASSRSPDSFHEDQNTALDDTGPSIPWPPSPSDHQTTHVTWPAFESQLNAWFEHERANASEADLLLWETRRTQVLELTPWEINEGRPAWKKWVVWFWEDNGDGTWSHHLCSTTHSTLKKHWTTLTRTQKIVDPIRRAWHVSYNFPGGEEDVWWLYTEDPASPPSRSGSRARSRSPRTTPSSQARRRSPAPTMRQQDPLPLKEVPLKTDYATYEHELPDDLKTSMTLRWGIYSSAVPLAHSPRRMAPGILKTVFRYQEETHGHMTEEDWALLGDLFGAHAKGTPRVDPTSSEWNTMAHSLGSVCDIFPSSTFPHPYSKHGQHYTVHRIDFTADLTRHIPAHPAHLFVPLGVTMDAQPWLACLEDPLSVLHAMRAGWGETPADLLCALVRHGIPFRTIRLRTARPTPTSIDNKDQDRMGLQLLPQGYIPTTQDYAVYLTCLRDLILGCQGRPAILKGGIVWRLAMEILGKEENWVCRALSVPTDVRQSHFAIQYKNFDAVDDELTQQEEDMICGVYRIFNNDQAKELKGKNAASVSWWPKQDLWNHPACEWNKGYWAWENEVWFRKRREDILQGRATALTVKDWEAQMFRGRWPRSLTCLQKVASLRIQTIETQ